MTIDQLVSTFGPVAALLILALVTGARNVGGWPRAGRLGETGGGLVSA